MNKESSSYLNLFFVLLIGTFVAFVVYFLFEGINQINRFYSQNQNYAQYLPLLLFPLVLIFLQFVVKKSLYFPKSLKDFKSEQDQSITLSPWMSVFHFIGTLLSHLSGASLGRESAATLVSIGLAKVFKLQWEFWSTILAGIGFGAATGSYWAGVFFASELFKTNLKQKIFTLLGSMVSVNVLATLRHEPLISKPLVNLDQSFFKTLILVFVLSITAGMIMRLYKKLQNDLKEIFKRNRSIFWTLILMTGAALSWSYLKDYKGLGVSQLAQLSAIDPHFDFVLIKLTFTLICVSLGFWGGEFVPLVISGYVFGQSWAAVLNSSISIGGYLGAYLFFAAATRLKWTALVLAISLLGWSWILWLYILMSWCLLVSGTESLYGKNENRIFFKF